MSNIDNNRVASKFFSYAYEDELYWIDYKIINYYEHIKDLYHHLHIITVHDCVTFTPMYNESFILRSRSMSDKASDKRIDSVIKACNERWEARLRAELELDIDDTITNIERGY